MEIVHKILYAARGMLHYYPTYVITQITVSLSKLHLLAIVMSISYLLKIFLEGI
jgi:hypothetical protein